MTDYKFPLKERFNVAEGTTAFVFQASNFTFRAGQYVEIILETMERHFSIASGPNDQDILMIATRMRDSAFKKTLAEIPLGTPVKIKGPKGNFTLHEDPAKKAVFIAGGIGITPARSIIKDATERMLPHKISLIYLNRNPESAVFLEDLKNWEKENPNLKLCLRMTEQEGRLDTDFIRKCAGDLSNTTFYVVGPPEMVQGVTKILEESGVSRDDMRFEEFTGY